MAGRLSACAFDAHPLPEQCWPVFAGRRPDLERASAADVTLAEQFRLADSPRIRVRRALAGNPSLDPQVQLRLAADTGAALFLAANPGLTQEVQSLLLSRRDSGITRSIASHGDLRPHVQQWLAATPGYRAALARNRRLPAPMYAALSDRADVAIRTSLAANPNAGPQVLNGLAGDRLVEIRQRAAGNPSLPEAGQLSLGFDGDLAVRITLARNPAILFDVQYLLAHDIPAVVWALAHNPAIDPQVVRTLISRGEATHGLVANPSLGAEQQRDLVADSDPYARGRLAELPTLHEPLQALLAGDASPAVRRALSRNPNLAAGVQERLAAFDDPEIHSNLFMNPALARPALRVMLDRAVAGDLRWPLGQAPRVPALGLATHWCPASLGHPVAGPMVAMFSGKPRVLDAAVSHGDPLVRWGLLGNDRLGARRLGHLVDDEEPVIGQAARLRFFRGLAA